MKFTRETLDKILETILEIYFEHDNTLGLWEVMDHAKCLYKEEIETLDGGNL